MSGYSVKVKICGITNLKDALLAVEAGADALGFVFFKKSPRYVEPSVVRDIVENLPPFINTVGVFVNEDKTVIDSIVDLTGIDYIQLHGDESPETCALWKKSFKVFRVRDFVDLSLLERYACKTFFLDTYSKDSYGGTGMMFNWDIAVEAKRFGNVILSGGLNPENIQKAIRHVMPYGVDVSSGVESDVKGIKDPVKLSLFIHRAKSALR
ncbi:MAG: phosphoribosylanthranilate isomerase [Thermodesulfovibrionales bacterium]